MAITLRAFRIGAGESYFVVWIEASPLPIAAGTQDSRRETSIDERCRSSGNNDTTKQSRGGNHAMFL